MYFLGLDGGGSKTNAILSNISGSYLRRSAVGPGNVSTLGKDDIRELISNLIERLLDGKSVSRIQYATLCFAGIGREQERKMMGETAVTLVVTCS